MSGDDELIKEFLLESWEGLNQLDRDFVALEKAPRDRERLGAIFRCVHTIKGTSGFLALSKLEAVAHAGESLLSRLRDGDLVLDGEMTSALLAMVDAIRTMLTQVEADGSDGKEAFGEIVASLQALASGAARAAAKPAPAPAVKAASAPAPAPAVKAASAPPKEAKSALPPKVEAAAAPVVVPLPPPTPAAVPAAPVAPASIFVPKPSPGDDHHGHSMPAGPAVAEGGEAAGARGPSVSDTTIRVDVGLLDRVMNLVGELVLARNQIIQFGTTVKDAAFANASQRLNLLTTELQEGVMKTRMQPIGNVWNKFPRVVRDLSHSCGKKVNLELDGTETELDRTIIEAIKDPLTHAVRNAVDHGIERPEVRLATGKSETGRLLLRAFHEGGQVNIEISDDGAGLDVNRIRQRAVERGLITADRAARMSEREIMHLIFQPGFSTAEKVTNVSGRGVGMDVVKTNIEKIGGTVDISSRPKHGTTLKIKIPLTLAIIPALIVTSNKDRYAIPQVNLLELVRLEGEQARRGLENLHGTTVYRLRGNLLPLVFLNRALELKSQTVSDVINIVVLQADDRQFGLVVDGISDTEEIVVKPLGKELKGITTFAGATIMGDGRVALILDVLGIAQRSGVVSVGRERAMVDKTTERKDKAEEKEALLLFRVGKTGRMALPLSMVARLEEISRDDVERAAGRDVVQYRDAILPLVDLGRALGAEPTNSGGGPMQVIVYSENGRSVGFVVDQILDAVEEIISIRHKGGRDGVLGSAVVQGKVTDLLDVHGVIRRSDPSFFQRGEAA